MLEKSKEQLALEYPQLKADIDLCYEYLFDICGRKYKKAVLHIPPQPSDFDMQISAALDELKAYRESGLTPHDVQKMQSNKELRAMLEKSGKKEKKQ